MIILANLGLTFARQPVQIVSVFPNQNKLYVSRRATITAQFDTEMDASTINGRTFIVRGEDSGPKFGAISYDSMTKSARFEPLNEFFAVEVVTVTLTCSVRTVQQEPFAGFTWQFTVEAFNPTPPYFAEGQNLRLPSRQNELYTVDLDKDGDLDIVVGQRLTAEPVTVIRNDSNGQFSQLENYELRIDARSIFGNDFDNDGDVDLLVTTASIEGDIAVFLNDGDGLFPIVRRFTQAFHEAFFVGRTLAGDFNNDGNVDLVYISAHVDSAYGYVGFMGNDGQANFNEIVQIRLRNLPLRVNVADFNNDGWLDVVVGMQLRAFQPEWWNGMAVLLNNADGTFSEPKYYTYFLRTESLYSNDFDGDGDIDIAVAMNPEGLLIYLNDGSGAFPDSVDLRDRDSIFNVWGADVDGDGDIDLLETQDPRWPDVPAVRLYLNPGDGHFSFFNVLDLKVIPDIDLRGYGRRPDGGDLDGDGDIDLVVPFDSSGSWLSFYFNQADPVSVDDGRANSPTDFVLEQNYPNPFNAETRIAFTLTTQARVRLTIYDVTGRQVITLADKEMLADRNWVRWDGRNAKGEVMASGVYFYKLEVLARNLNRIVKSRKMLLR